MHRGGVGLALAAAHHQPLLGDLAERHLRRRLTGQVSQYVRLGGRHPARKHGPNWQTQGMSIRRQVLCALSTAAIAASCVALAGGPAQAGPGRGRAVVHVDASRATVKEQSDGSLVLRMKKSHGQWMGERANAQGKKRVRVGSINGRGLAASWEKLRYRSGVGASLVWNSAAARPKLAAVHVGKPKVHDAGISIPLTSSGRVPKKTLRNVAIHLDRAPKGESAQAATTYPYITQENVVDDFWLYVKANDESSAYTKIYNSSNNNTCFSVNLNGNTPVVSVGNNRCDDIAYTNTHISPSTAYPSYGVTGNFPVDEPGSVGYSMNLTPDGQDEYAYVHVFDI